MLSGIEIKDATSGFRCLSKEPALLIDVESDSTYTFETIIQLSRNRMRIETVPVEVNPKSCESQLFTSNVDYVFRTLTTLIKLYVDNHAPFFILLLMFVLGIASLAFSLDSFGYVT